MSDTKTLKAARDANLDQLLEAFNKYIDVEIKRNEDTVTLLERILEGHDTPTSASKTVIDEITVLAETDLSTFLSG